MEQPSTDLARPAGLTATPVRVLDHRDDGPNLSQRLRLLPWGPYARLTSFARPRVAVHPAMTNADLAEAQSIQRALFAVRAFAVILILGLFAIEPNVQMAWYAGGILALVVALTIQFAWFRSGRPQLAALIAFAGVACDSAAGYFVGQAYIASVDWVTFLGYPLVAMEAALIFGPIGAIASVGASVVATAAQLAERASLGFPATSAFQINVLAIYLLYAVFISVTVGVNRRSRGDMRALLDVAGLLTQQESPTRIAQTLDARLRALVGARVRSIAVRRPDGTYEIRRWRTPETRTVGLEAVAALSAHVGRDVELDMRDGRTLTLEIERGRDMILIGGLGLPDWVRALTLVPIHTEGHLMGILPVLWDRRRVPDPSEIELLRGLADQTGLAFGQAQARRARELAATDSLTGLANHRAFRDALTARIAEARRHHGRLAILFTDLDRFKAVNDRHGHAVGDLFLHRIAQAVRAAARTEDVVARYGGDEFALILPSAGLAAAQEVGQRLRDEVLAAEGGMDVDLTVGIALYPEDGADVEALIERADAAMYAGKRRGGGRVVAASDVEVEP
jgi:diguanylate cyclase (GGDEF)-like protein